jgi:hypothetical protein
MPLWFMLSGNEPEKLQETFLNFFSNYNFPQGVTLWKWKRSFWICSPEKFRQEILITFKRYSVIEFSSAPSPTDIEFVSGDTTSRKLSS